MSRIISYRCEGCGLLYKILIRNDKITVSLLDNLLSESQVFDSKGFLICIECKHKNKLRIEKVY